METLTYFVLLGATIFLLSQSVSAQIGLDWNKLKGEDVDGQNSTNEDGGRFDPGDIESIVEGLWKQLQNLNPGGFTGENLPIPIPGFLPDEDEINSTAIPKYVTEDGGDSPGKPASQYPAGFEGLAYVSPQCMNHTMTAIGDFFDQKGYASKMVYSSGSLIPDPSSTFTYSSVDLGLFDDCRDVQATNEDTPFDAQYCILSVFIPEAQIHTAQCVPASCSDSDLYIIYGTLKAALEVPEEIPIHIACERPVALDGAAIFVIFLLVVLGGLMLAGTLYHLIIIHKEARKKRPSNTFERINNEQPAEAEETEELNKDGENTADAAAEIKEDADAADDKDTPKSMDIQEGEAEPKKPKKQSTLGNILMCFSVIHNFGKIFDISQKSGTMNALNGLRVISMFWIILGHTWQFISTWRLGNPGQLYTKIISEFWFQTILQAVFAVDTFFLLSGLLLAYLTLKSLKKGDGKLNWGLYYFHRFFRITPLYMFVMGVYVTLPIHIGSGPGKTGFFRGAREQCLHYWWTNMAYVNNLYPFPGDLGAQCMGWGWYLANDMQYFMISPLILILLYKNRKFGFAAIGALFLISYTSTIGISTYYGLNVGINQQLFNNRTADHPTADHLYGKPYHRIQPYLIGLMIGYMLFKLDGKTFKIPRLVSAGCWIVAIISGTSVIYGLFNTAQGVIITQGATVFYLTVNATAWGLAVGWVAFACIKGYGGPVNTILSWPVWTPLARLTFAAYLVHPIVIFLYINCLRDLVYISMTSMTFHFIAFTCVSYATALLFSLALEAPLMGLEKLWFKR